MATHKTALVINDSASGHKSPWDGDFPERPERLLKSVEALRQRNILPRCHLLTPRRATLEELTLCHPEVFVEFVQSTEAAKEDDLKTLAASYEEVYFCNATYESALVSAGSALEAMDSVINNSCENAFALIRPPGHHAHGSNANGFCVFNNVAICAKVAVESRGIRRVLIVDWDVHAGQGTQYLVQGDDRILFISIHQYLHGLAWPYQKDVDYDTEYANVVNIPLNILGAGDAEYMAAFSHIILPLVAEFEPQLILISCGFDAAIGDPLGRMCVSPAAFGHMTRLLQSIGGRGKLCALLEGGYFIESLVECVSCTVKALLGDSLPSLAPMPVVNAAFVETLCNVANHHSKRWKCMQTVLSALTEMRKAEKLAAFRPRSLFEFGGKMFRQSTDEMLRAKTFPTQNAFLHRSEELDQVYENILNEILSGYPIVEAIESRIVAKVEELGCRSYSLQLNRLYSLSNDRDILLSVFGDLIKPGRIVLLELCDAESVTLSTDSEHMTIIRIPFVCKPAGSDDEITATLCHVLLPILYNFSPQLIIISMADTLSFEIPTMPLLCLLNLVAPTIILANPAESSTKAAGNSTKRHDFPAHMGKNWSELAKANVGFIQSLLLDDKQLDISYQNQILSMAEQIKYRRERLPIRSDSDLHCVYRCWSDDGCRSL